ncbi:RNA polymerase sigma factor SigJ [Streptomyces sp. NPDC018031]|uniref:RNA polymerase sigma factor SigJ n=1 Tax=Streptomyces sp. NPDC018031 TaxID=3365033 RepID=UPI00379677A1
MTDHAQPRRDEPDAGLDTIISERRRLIGLAYRLLGSLAEAEDAVQETYTRWYAMSRQQQEAIETPGAWLATVATRVCLDLLGSARVRRERYVGEWIPEPLPERADWISGRSGTAANDPADPADRVTLDESVSMALLVVLESMTPAQRVALILHDVFGYPFGEIAGITGRTPAACRELASSARRRVRASLPPENPTAHQERLVRQFKQAWDAQDINALVGLLAPGATFTADGGGVVAAAVHPIEGGEGIARYLTGLAVRAAGALTVLERMVNGQAGLVIEHEGVTVAVYAFNVADDRITQIWAVRNPDKLRPWRAG